MDRSLFIWIYIAQDSRDCDSLLQILRITINEEVTVCNTYFCSFMKDVIAIKVVKRCDPSAADIHMILISNIYTLRRIHPGANHRGLRV